MRIFTDFVAALFGVIAAGLILASNMSSSRAVNCFWSTSSTRYDVSVEHGCLLVRQLRDYRFATPFRWEVYKSETPRQLAWFKSASPWWHGDNSRWERVGYTVDERQRHFGFEYATGKYWPPFVWQHPIVPFTVYQIPFWALVMLFIPLPSTRCFNKIAAAKRRKNAPETFMADNANADGLKPVNSTHRCL